MNIPVKYSEKYRNKKKWTFDDFHLLPPEYRCEILSGVLNEPPSPGYSHQRGSRILEYEFIHFVEENKLGEVLNAPMDVILDKENVVQPDIIFVSKKRKSNIHERGIMGAPDLVVEIISPSSVKTDRFEKMKLYERFGVIEYWIVDSANKSVEVYFLLKKVNRYKIFSSAAGRGVVKSKVLPGFRFNIEKLFTS